MRGDDRARCSCRPCRGRFRIRALRAHEPRARALSHAGDDTDERGLQFAQYRNGGAGRRLRDLARDASGCSRAFAARGAACYRRGNDAALCAHRGSARSDRLSRSHRRRTSHGAHPSFVQSRSTGSERDEHPAWHSHRRAGAQAPRGQVRRTMNAPLPSYLDYAATTPIDPRVAEAMIECLREPELPGKPSPMGHEYGRRARARVEQARAQVAAAVNGRPECIVWTSGATESNNLALLGVARFHADRGKHIVSSKTEHKAVLDALKQLESEGFFVTYLKPGADGIVAPEQVSEALRDDTQLVSLMHVNNEIGIIQDVGAIGRICRERGILFHVDAAQSMGKVGIDVQAMCVDLLSLTAHKSYGPKGV